MTPQDVDVLKRASAFLNRSYSTAFNTLAALEAESNAPSDPRVALVSLQAAKESLQGIRRDLDEKPVLTDRHIADILAMKENIGGDLVDLNVRRVTKSLEALEKKTMSESSVRDVRHAGAFSDMQASRELRKVFDLVETKLAAVEGREPDLSTNGNEMKRY